MGFIFDNPDQEKLKKRGYIFYLESKNIADQMKLFEEYGVGLKAPNGYFGENWDAFSDCLLDLQWIDIRDIFIIHNEFPQLPPADASNYIEILNYAMKSWEDKKTDELHKIYPDFIPHRITVFFPIDLENIVTSYCGKADNH